MFRPGGWDPPFAGGLLLELDEELHFNRYRAATLHAWWEGALPWHSDYAQHCIAHEDACLSAGAWGKLWTNDSTARMFSGGLASDLDRDGAPRWKQPALYDALKDTAPLLPAGIRLARVATHNRVDGVFTHDQRGAQALAAPRSLAIAQATSRGMGCFLRRDRRSSAVVVGCVGVA